MNSKVEIKYEDERVNNANELLTGDFLMCEDDLHIVISTQHPTADIMRIKDGREFRLKDNAEIQIVSVKIIIKI